MNKERQHETRKFEEVKFKMGYVQLKKERYDNFKNILKKGAQKRQ